MNYRLLIILSPLMLLLGSCSGVKNLNKAQVELPQSYNAPTWADSASIADMEWWAYYSDPELRSIIEHTLANNKDFLKAAAKVEEVRRLYDMEKVNLTPTVSGIA
ncbi:MAG: TolC family protein, partial [Paramuribaculum sp.]|nr:TolC family protein [Paramuribaculum sp.]